MGSLCELTCVVLSSNPSWQFPVTVAKHLKIGFELHLVDHDLFVSFNVKYADTKLNSPHDVLNCMYGNYKLSFLPNLGTVDLILNIIPATSCSAERSFNVLRKLKTYHRERLALLRIQRAYNNRVDTEKVID